jgi:hypothetical protein
VSEHTQPLARARELVDAQAGANYLAVDRSWVYTHAAELGARPAGRGTESTAQVQPRGGRRAADRLPRWQEVTGH